MKQSSRQSSKADILIVDDTLDNLRVLFNLLTEQGYVVRGASNGTSALKAAQLEPPDLILLDVRMPGMDGYEICRQLKADDRTNAIPVLFLSALHEAVNKVKGFDVGGVDYISKPFQAEEVVARVATHLQLVETQKRVKEQNTQLQQEIAERQRTEEALRASQTELRTLFAAIRDVIMVLDREGRYLKIAPTSPDLLYKPIPEVMGKTLQEVFLPTDANRFLAVIRQSLDTQQMMSIEYKLSIHGRDLWFDGRVSPMSADTVLVIARDITPRKHMEEDLREAKEAAEASSRAKSVFLANMSHELRTPLTSILGFARALERDSALTDRQCKDVAIIRRNGEHLLTLINDILDFTRIETNRFELRPIEFNLSGMLSQLADMTQINAEQKGLAFVYDAPIELPQIVFADQQRLRQILINLLGNAVKFTEQGCVTLKIFMVQEGGQPEICHLKFTIQDTGIGIPSEQLEAIFQPFQQADPYKLQEGSTGLGLAISQRLVAMMGSQLHVSSSGRQGSTFWFDLKLPVLKIPEVRSSPETLADSSIPPLATLLSAEWIATLKRAAEESDIETLFEVITHLRERNTELADTLKQLIDNFDYDTILALIQRTEQQTIEKAKNALDKKHE